MLFESLKDNPLTQFVYEIHLKTVMWCDGMAEGMLFQGIIRILDMEK